MAWVLIQQALAATRTTTRLRQQAHAPSHGRREDKSFLPDGEETAKWVQQQVNQYGKPEGENQQPWQAMQHDNEKDAEYTLTRWGVRDGKDLVFHMTKEAVKRA